METLEDRLDEILFPYFPEQEKGLATQRTLDEFLSLKKKRVYLSSVVFETCKILKIAADNSTWLNSASEYAV